MTVDRQRFCPVCDRAFNEGEPVLRCEGCGVIHHPGCWVRNGGCYTGGEHENTPHPEAYELGPALRGPDPSAPPVSVRRATPAPPPGAPPRTIVDRETLSPHYEERSADTGPVIGRSQPNAGPAAVPPVAAPAVPAPPRAKRPAPYSAKRGGDPSMPKIYGHRRILGYWYVPAAILVAAAVAFGVIWVVERFTGDDDGKANVAVDANPTNTPTPPPGATPTPTAPFSVQTPGADETAVVADPDAKFAPGDRARVIDTGDCLNVRVGPGLENDAIVCLPDGAEVTVLGGPQAGDGFSWWQVDTPNGQGWAAQDYLERIP